MGDAVVQIIDGLVNVIQVTSPQGPPGPAGVTFFDVRANGYSGEGTPGASLVILNSAGHADISVMPGGNYIALHCGGGCTLTLVPPELAAVYEVLNGDGLSSAAVTWGA